jgi:hypothetical protein
LAAGGGRTLSPLLMGCPCTLGDLCRLFYFWGSVVLPRFSGICWTCWALAVVTVYKIMQMAKKFVWNGMGLANSRWNTAGAMAQLMAL